MTSSVLVPLPVAAPIAVAAILAALNKHLPRRIADVAAIATTLATGGISLALLHASQAHPLVYWFGGWTPRAGAALGISFVVDPVSAGLAAFVSLLMLAAFVFSLEYFDSIGTIFHVLMLGFLAAMCGFSLTGDLFNLFVWFELMSAAAFALCGYKTEETSSQQGALNFAITNTVGAFLVLWGIAMLYARTGALNMAQIGRALSNQSDALVITSFVLILCGFYVKAAAFPFHFWLADAHAIAPTPVCVLFSGVMVELGVYAVARVYWAIFDGPFAAHRAAVMSLLVTVGTITALLGAVMCFGQRHLKRLLAFSTVSHVGLLIIAFALLKPDALAGAAIYTIGHGLSKAALFVCAGILLHRFGTADELELRGRARPLRWTLVVFCLGGLGLASTPPLATFFGEHGIEEAAAQSGQSWVWMVFLICGALTAGAVFRVAGRAWFGWGEQERGAIAGANKIEERRETRGPHSRVPASMFLAGAVLACGALAVGLMPGLSQAARTGAYTMADAAGYQSRVLDDAALPLRVPEPEHSPMGGSAARALAATALAIGLTAWSLSPAWPRKRRYARPVRRTMDGLRDLHSGHVGDYVTFQTFGVAAMVIALALLMRRL
jgi:multicomponent Na+:H+ antiporter subunit D